MKRRSLLARLGAAGVALAARPIGAWPQDSAPGQGRTTGQAEKLDWANVRDQFQLSPKSAYFNTAGLGTCPRLVSNRVKAEMDREEEAPSPGHSETDWQRIRGKLASLLGAGCRASEIAIVSTATEGINIILNGLPWQAGDEIVTSTHEHPALAIPLLHKMRTQGVVIRTFEPDPASSSATLDRLRRELSAKTRMIFVSHVTCTTGQVLPVEEIGRLAGERRLWFALDGAQSLAQGPIDIAAIGAHFYTASCHKWLLGPKRTGVLYVRQDHQDTLRPSVVGAYSDNGYSLATKDLAFQPTAQRYEYGTQNDALVYGLEAAVDFVTGLGLARIAEHNQKLTDECLQGVRKIPGVQVLSPSAPPARSAMVTIRVVGRDNREVAAVLTRRGHRVRSVTEAGLDAVRASFHVCNDERQVHLLVEALDDYVNGE
jgi:selenocysteine lyase/cysteine desulfurase